MPIYTICFLFFTLANIGFPGTSSFIGEFLILLGCFKINIVISFISAISMVISAGYSLWLFNRIVYGNLKIQYLISFLDLNFREIFIFIPLIVCSLITGLYSNIFLNSINISVNYLIELLYI